MIYIFAKQQRIFKEPERRRFKNYDALLNFFIKEQKKSKNIEYLKEKIVAVFQRQEKINIIMRESGRERYVWVPTDFALDYNFHKRTCKEIPVFDDRNFEYNNFNRYAKKQEIKNRIKKLG